MKAYKATSRETLKGETMNLLEAEDVRKLASRLYLLRGIQRKSEDITERATAQRKIDHIKKSIANHASVNVEFALVTTVLSV